MSGVILRFALTEVEGLPERLAQFLPVEHRSSFCLGLAGLSIEVGKPVFRPTTGAVENRLVGRLECPVRLVADELLGVAVPAPHLDTHGGPHAK